MNWKRISSLSFCYTLVWSCNGKVKGIVLSFKTVVVMVMEFPQKFSRQLFSRSARLHKSADFWLKISIKWHEFLISCKAGSVSHLIELIDSNCWQKNHAMILWSKQKTVFLNL